MTKLYKKSWQFDLFCAILGIAFAVVLFIPSVATKIISISVGVLLIFFFVTMICPKFKNIRSFGAEWVCWFLIEAIAVLALGILAIVNQKVEIKFLFITLQLSHIIGLVICLEGVVGLIKLINNYPKDAEKRPRKSVKYTYILAVIIGTYVFTNINISNQDLAIFLGVVAIGFAIISIVFMTSNLPEKTEEQKQKAAEKKKKKEEEKAKKAESKK